MYSGPQKYFNEVFISVFRRISKHTRNRESRYNLVWLNEVELEMHCFYCIIALADLTVHLSM